MKKVQLYGLTSLLAAGLLVAGWGAVSALAAKAPGKLRTRTGVLLEKEGMRLSVKGTKKQDPVVILLSPDTRIVLESPAGTDALVPESLVRIQGKGKKNRLEAKRLVLLPAEQTLRLVKQAKKGPAYSAEGQKTEITAKITHHKPLRVVNRHHQTLQVTLDEKSKVVKQTVTDDKALRAGMKITVKFMEQAKGNQAREVIVHAAKKVKQVKK